MGGRKNARTDAGAPGAGPDISQRLSQAAADEVFGVATKTATKRAG